SESRNSPTGSPWRSNTGSLHALLCGRQCDRRKSGASRETLGLENRTLEPGAAEYYKAFAYGLATVHECLRSAFSGLTLIPEPNGLFWQAGGSLPFGRCRIGSPLSGRPFGEGC